MAEEKGNPIVAIAGVIGGISVAIVAILAILARNQLSVAPWIVAPLALMGIILGFFAATASKQQ